MSSHLRIGSVTLILSSYNQAPALRLVLHALALQDAAVDEILVADDGSRDDSEQVVSDLASRLKLPVRDFLTQEDRGFRKATALNRAVRASRGQQIVFLDGDVLPGPGWLAAHKAAFRTGGYAVGDYYRMEEPDCRSLQPDTLDGQIREWMDRPSLKRWFAARHLKACWYIATRKRRRPLLMGGNFSVDRGVLFGVNGFDEIFNGFGGEDADLRNRMYIYGARARSVIARAKSFHLPFAVASSSQARQDVSRRSFKESRYRELAGRRVWAEIGLV